MLNKNTLTALGAALIALGQELQGSETTDAPPTSDPQPATTRRGRGPAKAAETPAEPEKPAGVKTNAELREIARLVIEGGKAEKLKAFMKTQGADKISDLPPASHAAFIAEVKRLQLELDAESI